MINWLLKIFPFVIEKRNLTPSELGKAGEEESVRFLKRNGLKILDRNVKVGRKEIDLIAKDGDEVVFIEVKTCRNESGFYPEDKVNYKKRKNIKKAAQQYIIKCLPKTKYYRFDIIAIIWEPSVSIRWIKNAF
ncbi:MAG TPA: YraN family protein [Candidatus Hydrogenedens sp.]|nr:YraN family protein [Candidatus Hydrogenedens sp.]